MTIALYFVLVGSAAWYTFSNTLGHGYTWDDRSALIGNNDIRPAKQHLAGVWYNDFWGDPMDSEESHKSYRPLTIMSYRLNYAAHGMDPWGFHAANVCAHVLPG